MPEVKNTSAKKKSTKNDDESQADPFPGSVKDPVTGRYVLPANHVLPESD